jgi:maltose alpha-D-glucosyltransferase/alpha-amylase
MQWNGSWNSGFSEADAAALYSPIIVDAPYGYQAVNVTAQERSEASLLRWTRRLVAVRKKSQAFGRGRLTFLSADNPRVLAFLREHGEDRILVACNLAKSAEPATIDLGRFAGCTPVEMWSDQPFPRIGELPYQLTFGPYGYFWFRLTGACGPSTPP